MKEETDLKISRNPLALMAGDVKAKASWLYGRTGAGCILKALCTDGTFAMLTYRWMQFFQSWKLVPLAMIANKVNVIFGRCIIGRGADFGPRFVLIHSQGVVINSSVHGGEGIYIEHQVTIGAEKGGSPVLGNDVFIGAGAKIIGSVSIGDGAKIGANAVVLDDVPAHATAVGIPARIVERGATARP